MPDSIKNNLDTNQEPISVIMVNFNGIKYLKKTIPAMLELKYPNIELIIVDNGSSDGSIEFIKKFKQIKLLISPVIQSKNFACNFAVNNSNGKYILFLDNDCLIVEKTILNNLFIQYKSDQKIGAIGLSHIDDGMNCTHGYGCYFQNYLVKNNPEIDLLQIKSHHDSLVGFPSGIGIFIKKSIWNDVGGYDTNFLFSGDDFDLGIKLWIYGFTNHLYAKSTQIHLGLDERTNNSKYYFKLKNTVGSTLYTILKNYNYLNLLPALVVMGMFFFLKTIKQVFSRLSPILFLSYFEGLGLFIKMMLPAIKERIIIQKKRVIFRDIFLYIKPKNNLND